MGQAPISTEGRRRLTLAGHLDHSVLHSLKSELLAALSDGSDVEIDASRVRRMSTPVMQLLVAARIGALSGDCGAVRFVSPSDAFGDFARTLALGEALGLMEASL
jgi:ABC-type transporter Mla MlaB component